MTNRGGERSARTTVGWRAVGRRYGVVVAVATFVVASCTPPDPGGGGTPTTVTPTTVPAPPSPSAVAAGGDSTCVLMSNATVRCWGRNHRGQLGDGTTAGRSAAQPVTFNGGATFDLVGEVDLGDDFACARRFGGTVWCWGANDRGQLGDGTTVDRSQPVQVEVAPGSPLTGIIGLAVSDDADPVNNGGFACGTTSVGTAWCWGANGAGQLTTGDPVDRTRAVPLMQDATTAQGGIVDLDVAGAGGCLVFTDTTAKCWGGIVRGDGGIVPSTVYPSNVLVGPGAPLTGAVSAAIGPTHACFLLGSQAVACHGSALAVGTGAGAALYAAPVIAAAPSTVLTGVVQISAGGPANCARMAGGTARCWGTGWMGAGQPPEAAAIASSEVQTAGGPVTGVVQVSAAPTHGCVVVSDATTRCWGSNAFGELGDGTTANRTTAVTVLGLS